VHPWRSGVGCILNGMAVNLFSILASDKHYIYFKIDLKMFCDRKSGSTLRLTGHEVGTFRHLQLGTLNEWVSCQWSKWALGAPENGWLLGYLLLISKICIVFVFFFCICILFVFVFCYFLILSEWYWKTTPFLILNELSHYILWNAAFFLCEMFVMKVYSWDTAECKHKMLTNTCRRAKHHWLTLTV
jgi:hypothetical protein